MAVLSDEYRTLFDNPEQIRNLNPRLLDMTRALVDRISGSVSEPCHAGEAGCDDRINPLYGKCSDRERSEEGKRQSLMETRSQKM